jgi:synaptobrevin family protein YKT6
LEVYPTCVIIALFIICAEYYVHVYMRADGLCGSVTCDAEYPPRVAFSLLTRLLEDFSTFKPDWAKETRNESVSWPQLESDVVKYQDPANADQIMKIQRSLDETRDVLHNTIGQPVYLGLAASLPLTMSYVHPILPTDSVLQRGEKLEDLVERSGELSAQSKLFYREAKRANSCCAVV